jgi:hypothetical protein
MYFSKAKLEKASHQLPLHKKGDPHQQQLVANLNKKLQSFKIID